MGIIIDFLKNNYLTDNIIRRNPIYYSNIKNTTYKIFCKDLEERESEINKLLNLVLEKASKTNYGKKVYNYFDISSWPYLDKKMLKNNITMFLRYTPQLRIPAYTSGSTGQPLKLFRSLKSVVAEQVFLDILIQRYIQKKDMKTAVLRGNAIKDPNDFCPPFWKLRKDKIILSSFHLSDKTVSYYYDILNDYKPDCLMAYPGSLEYLVMLLKERGLTLNIPLVITSSEILTNEIRSDAIRVLNCKFMDIYGLAERVALAYSVAPNEYFFFPGYAFIELKYHSSETEYDFYEIVGTSLWNYLMPLVRYRTGDLIIVPRNTSSSELKEIALGLKPYLGILGREMDYILTPRGKYFACGLFFWNVENVVRAQIIQESIKEINVKIIPTSNFSNKDKRIILDNIYSRLPNEMEISLQIVSDLEKSRNGKVPFIIRKI